MFLLNSAAKTFSFYESQKKYCKVYKEIRYCIIVIIFFEIETVFLLDKLKEDTLKVLKI